MAGITKNTFLRWVSGGNYSDVTHRDRRGWRLFTQEDLDRLTDEVNRIQVKEKGVADKPETQPLYSVNN